MGITETMAQTGYSLVDPLAQLWYGFVRFLPGIIGALLVLIIGYIIGVFLGFVVEKVLVKVKLDKLLLKKAKLSKVSGAFKISAFLGLITKWYIFILFLAPAANIIQLRPLSEVLMRLGLWLPNLIAAIIIVFIGFIAAEYVADKVRATKAAAARLIADIVKIVIIIFTLLIALNQISIDVAIAESSFLIILGGIVFAIALAFGLGFGLAMPGEVKDIVRKIKKRL